MKMYQDYDSGRDQTNKYFDPQDNALIRFFTSNGYYPEESGMNHLDYMREFHGSFNGIDSTASSKSLLFKTDPEEDTEAWKGEDPKNWSNSDVLHWIASVAEYHKFPYESVNANAFNVDGKTLVSMPKKEFVLRDEKYGLVLYKTLHKSSSDFEDIESVFHSPQSCKVEVKLETLSTPAKIPDGLIPLASNTLKQTPSFGLVGISEGFHNDITNSSESYPFELDPVATEKPISTINSLNNINNNNNNSNSNVESIESKSSERKNSTDLSLGSDTEHSDFEVKKKNKKGGKRPPGRPPGVKTNKEKPEKKTGRLWEFIRDLLLDPQHCPSVICWENYDDGVFRFVKSEKVAKIWGDRKGNEKMNYEKLSRAMRYYYRSKVLQPVIGRRLVYKFGPTARGWKTENPNFRH